jgi:tetratricopeptide (TPR) repeat protein
LDLDPDNIDAMNSTATCLKNLSSDHFDPCLSLYMRALEVDPEDFETNFNIGILYYDQRKDAKKAMHYLKIAIAEDKQPTALFNLAVIYEE